MKRSTKGALAVVAAAVLLLAVPTTIAYWTDEETVDGGTVDSGEIDLSAVACDTAWTHTEDGGAVTTIVPGDSIEKQCTGTLTLVGDHIGATVDISDASLTSTGGLQDELTVAAVMSSPAPTITEPGTYDITIDLTVDFPYGTVSEPDPVTGADNDSQLDTATLDAIELVAVQTHN
jgi:alternate signal-mediated exported protein